MEDAGERELMVLFKGLKYKFLSLKRWSKTRRKWIGEELVEGEARAMKRKRQGEAMEEENERQMQSGLSFYRKSQLACMFWLEDPYWLHGRKGRGRQSSPAEIGRIWLVSHARGSQKSQVSNLLHAGNEHSAECWRIGRTSNIRPNVYDWDKKNNNNRRAFHASHAYIEYKVDR